MDTIARCDYGLFEFLKDDDVAVQSNWAGKRLFVLCGAVCILFLVTTGHSYMAVIHSNIGWAALASGLTAEPDQATSALLAAQGWFDRAAASGIASDTRYGWCIATLGLPDSNERSTCNWAAWKESPRSRVYLNSALLLAMRRIDQQDLSTSSLNLESSQVKMKLAQYEELAEIQKPDVEEILRLIAQNLIAGRVENVAFWQQQILIRYPGQEYLWLHDIQNPFAQVALAEMVDKLGQRSEAIRMGEQAVALNHWHWGHYVVAGFYLEEGRITEAERHLQQAIVYGGADPIVTRYRVELADLYAGQKQVAAAQEQYCAVIKEMPANNHEGAILRERALSGLSRMFDYRDIRQGFSLCSTY